MEKPSCEDLLEEDGYEEVLRESDASWRHGTYEHRVYKRLSDETFWAADYRLSTDGETNELREGSATIYQVEPKQVTVTSYVPIEGE